MVIEARPTAVRYAAFESTSAHPAVAGRLDRVPGVGTETAEARSALREATERCLAQGVSLQYVAIKVPFGGAVFREHTRANEGTIRELDRLRRIAPLAAGPSAVAARAALDVFRGIPVVMVFETAFFTALPARERMYAIDAQTSRSFGMARTGYHGLLHAAAARLAARKSVGSAPARIFSLCLEPISEAAAVIGDKPVMVSSGATPLEGLPGESTCGDVDPGAVLEVARGRRWGPEQVNQMLMHRSGLSAVAGRPVTLAEVFAAQRDEGLDKARNLMLYRILLYAGATAAAMGGMDTIVVSGRYSHLADEVGAWLVERLSHAGWPGRRDILTCRLETTADRVAADEALAVALPLLKIVA